MDTNPFTDQTINLRTSMSTYLGTAMEELKERGQFKGFQAIKQRKYIQDARKNLQKKKRIVNSIV